MDDLTSRFERLSPVAARSEERAVVSAVLCGRIVAVEAVADPGVPAESELVADR
ncbi:hypothetical protein Val02_23930 [Virgisporangium aliadipatigenens]|uniref:Uncharacterized protein n=1 Tax=Virgisporangium aliadipatigenens TaxID=741659 RepID=A0A8J4DQM4_9ACTN|nr:hypothetical protein [Virgisporangium aliadipatigenens]GIJ45507.1 hypothetical protein Val02_23930 [Virgisporangium aliadipatigenens]